MHIKTSNYLLFLLILITGCVSNDGFDVESDVELKLDTDILDTHIYERQVGISDLELCKFFCSTYYNHTFPNTGRTYYSFTSTGDFYVNQEQYQLFLSLSFTDDRDDLKTGEQIEKLFVTGEYKNSSFGGNLILDSSTRISLRLTKWPYTQTDTVYRPNDCMTEATISKFWLKEVTRHEDIARFGGEDIIVIDAEFDMHLCSLEDDIISMKGDLVFYFRTDI